MKPIKSKLRRSLFWGADATLMKIFFHRDRNLFILSYDIFCYASLFIQVAGVNYLNWVNGENVQMVTQVPN